MASDDPKQPGLADLNGEMMQAWSPLTYQIPQLPSCWEIFTPVRMPRS